MDGSGAPGLPGGCLGGGLLKVFNVSLDEVVNERQPEASLSLPYSGADDGSVGGCIRGIV